MWTEELEVAKMGFGDIINVLKEACKYIFTNEKAPYGFWSSGNNANIFSFIISVFLLMLVSCIVFIFFKDRERLMWIPSKIFTICFLIGIFLIIFTETLESLVFTGYMLDILIIYSVLCGCIFWIKILTEKIKARKAKK